MSFPTVSGGCFFDNGMTVVDFIAWVVLMDGGGGGGGVACHVAETAVYGRLHDIEGDEHEVPWIRLKPKKLPRKYSCIIIAFIYQPPGAENGWLR